MKIVPLELMTSTEQLDSSLYRHIPETDEEKKMVMEFMAEYLWRTSSGRKEMLGNVPYIEMKLPCNKHGCVAFLSISRDELSWNEDIWDGQGTLIGSITVRHINDCDGFDDPFSDNDKSDNLFPSQNSYRMYFSMVSADTTDTSEKEPRLLWEFPVNSSSSEDKNYEKDTNHLPSLTLPPNHPHYGESNSARRDRTISDTQFRNELIQHSLHSERKLSYNADHNIKARSSMIKPRAGEFEQGKFHEDDMRNHFPDEETYQNWIDSSD